MQKLDEAEIWLVRARSSLAKASLGGEKDKILYEDLCYDIQQSVEKGLKALCIIKGIKVPRTHDISYLMDRIEASGIELPLYFDSARSFTMYAVETRYPGFYDPVEKPEYEKALTIAFRLLNWIEKKVKAIGKKEP